MSHNKIMKTCGSVEILPDSYINVGNNRMLNVAQPLSISDGVNKRYVDNLNQSGDLKWSIKNADYNGWLICDGRSLSATVYAELFSIIGTTFGSNSMGTFKLPDCRGRTLGAVGAGTGLSTRNVGDTLGTETHVLTTNEMPGHTRTQVLLLQVVITRIHIMMHILQKLGEIK
jgi:hypothetical protein